jgi:DNA-binding response OmpR family regulator
MTASALTEPPKILVVDDSLVAAGLVRLMLGREPYEFVHAASGEEALEIARRETPDLVLLDWMMPGVDGLETLRRLRRDPECERIPVIMISVRGNAHDVATALATGCIAYLTKPLEAGLLLAAVRAVLVRGGSASRAAVAGLQPLPPLR